MSPSLKLSKATIVLALGVLWASTADAGAVREEFFVPQPPIFIECLGEEVEGGVYVRQVLNVTFPPAGGIHAAASGTQKGTVTGLTSGSTWTLKGVGRAAFNTQSDQVVFTAVSNLTGTSPGNPVLQGIYRELHVVDANGETRSFHFIDTIRCKGKD